MSNLPEDSNSNLQNIYNLHWETTGTPSSDRVNLFAHGARGTRHIATITSGSRSQLEHFRAHVAVLSATPQVFALLLKASKLMKQHRFIQSSELNQFDRELHEIISKFGGPIEKISDI